MRILHISPIMFSLQLRNFSPSDLTPQYRESNLSSCLSLYYSPFIFANTCVWLGSAHILQNAERKENFAFNAHFCEHNWQQIPTYSCTKRWYQTTALRRQHIATTDTCYANELDFFYISHTSSLLKLGCRLHLYVQRKYKYLFAHHSWLLTPQACSVSLPPEETDLCVFLFERPQFGIRRLILLLRMRSTSFLVLVFNQTPGHVKIGSLVWPNSDTGHSFLRIFVCCVFSTMQTRHFWLRTKNPERRKKRNTVPACVGVYHKRFGQAFSIFVCWICYPSEADFACISERDALLCFLSMTFSIKSSMDLICRYWLVNMTSKQSNLSSIFCWYSSHSDVSFSVKKSEKPVNLKAMMLSHPVRMLKRVKVCCGTEDEWHTIQALADNYKMKVKNILSTLCMTSFFPVRHRTKFLNLSRTNPKTAMSSFSKLGFVRVWKGERTVSFKLAEVETHKKVANTTCFVSIRQVWITS